MGLLVTQRRRRRAGGDAWALPVPAGVVGTLTLHVQVLGHVDLDSLLLDRTEHLADVALARRVVQIGGQRVGEAVVVLAAVATERDALDGVDAVDELLSLPERGIDLGIRRARLPFQ